MASQAWMWLAAENKVDMVLRWEDCEWWFISSFCTKQLQQNLRFTFSRNHPPTKRTCRETSLSWEDIISFPKPKLHFLLLWSLKLIKLTLTFKCFKQKALFQIHHVKRTFGCQLWSSKPSSLSSSATQASQSTGYLSSAVTLADVCLGKLPWETKCGIIQPTTPSSQSLSSSSQSMMTMMMLSRSRIGRIVVCGLGVGRVEV